MLDKFPSWKKKDIFSSVNICTVVLKTELVQIIHSFGQMMGKQDSSHMVSTIFIIYLLDHQDTHLLTHRVSNGRQENNEDEDATPHLQGQRVKETLPLGLGTGLGHAEGEGGTIDKVGVVHPGQDLRDEHDAEHRQHHLLCLQAGHDLFKKERHGLCLCGPCTEKKKEIDNEASFHFYFSFIFPKYAHGAEPVV